MLHGGKRKGAGGPKGPRPKTATGVIQIRVSPHEKSVIEERASRRGMSVTEFIKVNTMTGKACRWTRERDDCDTWRSDCGALWSFIDDGPVENGMAFCHKCGNILEVSA
jgi:hypothetical protein